MEECTLNHVLVKKFTWNNNLDYIYFQWARANISFWKLKLIKWQKNIVGISISKDFLMPVSARKKSLN